MLSVTHASKLFSSFSFQEKGRQCHRFWNGLNFYNCVLGAKILSQRRHFLFYMSSRSNNFWSLFNEASNGKTQSHIQQIWMTEINWKGKQLKVNWILFFFFCKCILLAFFERTISNSRQRALSSLDLNEEKMDSCFSNRFEIGWRFWELLLHGFKFSSEIETENKNKKSEQLLFSLPLKILFDMSFPCTINMNFGCGELSLKLVY